MFSSQYHPYSVYPTSKFSLDRVTDGSKGNPGTPNKKISRNEEGNIKKPLRLNQ